MANVVRARTIVTCDGDAAQNAVTFEKLGMIADGAIAVGDDGRIEWIGPSHELPAETRDVEVHEFAECVIVPGLVDAHAHPLFAGNREADFAARLRGEKQLLGMAYTVERTREALGNPAAFWRVVRGRLRAIAEHGTTTLEVKTGYALTKAGELQLLDLIEAHKDEPGLPRLIATFLGAHAVPPEFKDEKQYVDFLIAEVLPEAAAHGAMFADVFCEAGFFSPHHARRYLEAARAYGLRLRAHCDEMSYGGAAAMAAPLSPDALDHCNAIDARDIEAIVRHGAVTVACPATIAYLGLSRHAPVRRILERGGCVALASDYNPGTSPCFNLQTVAYFGRSIFGLTAAEALYGVTRAGAQSLACDAGRLRAGAPADFVVLRLESPEEFGWQFGGNLAAAVYRTGARIA